MNRVKKEIFNPIEVFKPKMKYYRKPNYFSTLFPIKSTSPLKNELEIIEESCDENIKDDIYIDELIINETKEEEIFRSEAPVNIFHNISPVQLNTIECLKQEVELIITMYFVRYEFEKYNYILFEKRHDCTLIHKTNSISEINRIILHDDSMMAILNVTRNKIKYFKTIDEFYDFGLIDIC